jgi:hypothetical protein
LEKIIFTFSSFTYANKARRLLLRSAINAAPTKLGPSESVGGCAHGLSVSYKDYDSAVKPFIENGIAYGIVKDRYDIS